MQSFPPTIILRHRKENLKKCSLRGLEEREDLHFFTYPATSLPDFSDYLLLSFDGPPLKPQDSHRGIFMIDGTWRYAKKMFENTPGLEGLETRSLPETIRTAYPRKQEDCDFPDRGLASVEALYAAYAILGRDTEGLLDHYHWKEQFLINNRGL